MSYTHLTENERYVISHLHIADFSLREIARRLKRHHSTISRELKRNGAIASLSFGAERKFSFKHKKTKETAAQILEHGSLLIMKGETQSHWLHSLPTTKRASTPRINLTFRTIVAK